MINTTDKQIIFKYLTKTFKIIRIKHNGKFKRAIKIKNDVYIFSEHKNHSSLKHDIIAEIKLVLNYETNIIENVLSEFLPLN